MQNYKTYPPQEGQEAFLREAERTAGGGVPPDNRI